MMRRTAEDSLGTLRVEDGRAVVQYVRHLGHPPDTVWRALTEDEHLSGWFPTTVEGERTQGAALTFRFPDLDIPPMEGALRIFDPPSTLEFTWGEDILRFELEASGEGQTTLVLTVTMAEIGKAARDATGWHSCLDNLAAGLADDRSEAEQGRPWRAINRIYVEQFGPEASTIGPPKEWEARQGGE